MSVLCCSASRGRRAPPGRVPATSALAAGVLVAAACGTRRDVTAPAVAPRNLVQATPSLSFAPAEITIAAGDSVTWAFAGVTHTVVFQRGADTGAPADVGPTSDASVTRVFTRPGTFGYGCRLHPGMGGLIHVR